MTKLTSRQAAFLLQIASAVLLLGVFHGGTIIQYAQDSWPREAFSDDEVMHLPPMLHYHQPGCLSENYIMDYFRQAYLPSGYKAVYWLSSQAGIEPRILSKLLTYALVLTLTICAGVVAWHVGRSVFASWFAVVLCISSGTLVSRMAGGLPRSFGPTLTALATLALVRDQPLAFAVLVIAAAAFYPSAAVVLGVALAMYLLVRYRRHESLVGEWSMRRRCTLLAMCGILTLALLLPLLIGGRQYGGLIDGLDPTVFPEAATGGRFDEPPPYFTYPIIRAVWQSVRAPLCAAGKPYLDAMASHGPLREGLIDILLIGGLVGFALLARQDPTALRASIIPAAALLSSVLATVLSPHLNQPSRALISLEVWSTMAVPAGIAALPAHLRWTRERPWVKPVAVLLLCGLFLLVAGRKGDPVGGYAKRVRHPQVYEFIRTLPTNAVLAGWPGDEGIIDHTPFLCSRSVLVNWEAHVVFHREYVLELRRRTHALLDAYYRSDMGLLIGLRDQFSVTHLLVEVLCYGPLPPRYFPPFDARIEELHRRAHERGISALPAVWTLRPWAVYDDGKRFILDLRALESHDSVRPQRPQ